MYSGVSSMELRELEHPPQLWHYSKISISVTTIVTHIRKLGATTNNRLTGLLNSLPKPLFLIATRPKTAFFVSQLPSVMH